MRHQIPKRRSDGRHNLQRLVPYPLRRKVDCGVDLNRIDSIVVDIELRVAFDYRLRLTRWWRSLTRIDLEAGIFAWLLFGTIGGSTSRIYAPSTSL